MGNSCHRPEIPVIGRKFLSHEKNIGLEMKCMPQKGYSFHRKEIPVTDSKFLGREFLSNKKNTRRKFMLNEGHSWYRKGIPVTEENYCS